MSAHEQSTLDAGIAATWTRLQERKPLLHHITNLVVMNETANASLAVGALPVMAHAREEVEEMTSLADSLVLNIGTLTPELVETMILAGQAANRRGIPVVLDPVGAGATRLRTSSALRLMDHLKIAVLRGNAGEVATLMGSEAEVRGVESTATALEPREVAELAARRLGMVVAVTGPLDYVSDGTHTAEIANGHPWLAAITGTGCMSTTLVAAAAAVADDPFLAAVAALTWLGVAGEDAAEQSRGPGSFHVALYDTLAALTPERIRERSRVTPCPALRA